MALFESLSSKLQKITQKMGGKTRVTEADIKEMMREIKLALLEADVNFKVVKELIAEVSEKSKGALVLKSLTPGQQIVKLVHESLVEMLTAENTKLAISPTGFTVIMLFGLQGSGKTTTAAKLALALKKKGKRPFLLPVDVYRPAAIEQLNVLAKQISVPCYVNLQEKNPLTLAKEGLQRAEYLMCDTLILDTAGRTTIDEEMMTELARLQEIVKPHEKLLVLDAMIGQDAVSVAETFNERIGIDGYIMTKLDGDARGGASLSIQKVTQKPIKFLGFGEKVEALEQFYPDRMASRILGMGDVLSLIEKVSQEVSEEDVAKLTENLMNNRFSLEDMLAQLEQVKKMGSIKDLIGMIPGIKSEMLDESKINDKTIDRQIAIIRSMTPKERRNIQILDASRRKRIARGSGTTVQEINQLVNRFSETQKMMKKLGLSGKNLGQKGGIFGMGQKLSSLKNLLTKGGRPF